MPVHLEKCMFLFITMLSSLLKKKQSQGRVLVTVGNIKQTSLFVPLYKMVTDRATASSSYSLETMSSSCNINGSAPFLLSLLLIGGKLYLDYLCFYYDIVRSNITCSQC